MVISVLVRKERDFIMLVLIIGWIENQGVEAGLRELCIDGVVVECEDCV